MIGKRRLDRAIEEMRKAAPAFAPSLRWRVFQLNPTMPADGMDRSAYLAAKFGGAARAGEVYRVIGREGLDEGIAFAFDRIRRTPSTLKAHALIRLAAGEGRASEMAERLFGAYFLEGLDIGEGSVLEELATEVGLPMEGLKSYLADDGVVDGLRAEDAAARAKRISGVPFFVIDGRYSLAGAVAPEVLVRAMELARIQTAP
jgi:predicted DsbA family dithiol-disulfide isomerase